MRTVRSGGCGGLGDGGGLRKGGELQGSHELAILTPDDDAQVLEIFVDEKRNTATCELEISITKPHAGHTKIELLKVCDVITFEGSLIKSLRAYKG